MGQYQEFFQLLDFFNIDISISSINPVWVHQTMLLFVCMCVSVRFTE